MASSAASAAEKGTKSERTRRRIKASYLALLDETDFDKVSVSRICKEAGVVRSTFYVYFADVYELIQEVEDDALETLRHADDVTDESVAFDASRALTDWGFPIEPPFALARWFVLCEEVGLTLQAMLGQHGDPYFVQRFRKALEEHVRCTMNRDQMPQDALREGFVDAMVGTHLALVRDWLLDKETQLTPPAMVTIVNTMRIGGSTIGHYAAENNVPSWM